jgi:hypothetical protein
MGKYMGILTDFESIAIPIYMAMAMGNIWVWFIWLGQHWWALNHTISIIKWSLR